MQFCKVQNGKDKVNYVPSRKLEGILLQPVIYHTCPMDINIYQVIFMVNFVLKIFLIVHILCTCGAPHS